MPYCRLADMEMSPVTPARRLEGVRAYSRSADAFDTVAWRPPSAARFDARVANDPPHDPTIKDLEAEMPGWVVIAVGGLVAAILGMLLGGALAV